MWDLFDILTVAVRWIHAISAVVWIGGSIFYLVVLRPALRDVSRTGAPLNGRLNALVAAHFREWVHLSMVALLVSGAILTFDRLTEQSTSSTYIASLVIKISISFWLFGIGTATYTKRAIHRASLAPPEGASRKPLLARWLRPLVAPYMIVYGGLAVVLLSNILKIAFEKGIAR
ncbi:MAG: urate hydroxylase PuuD [Dehalococcoidia bacterium]